MGRKITKECQKCLKQVPSAKKVCPDCSFKFGSSSANFASKKADILSKSNYKQKNNENINKKIQIVEQILDKNKYNAESSNDEKLIENINEDSEMCKNINQNENLDIEKKVSKSTNGNAQVPVKENINVPDKDNFIIDNNKLNMKNTNMNIDNDNINIDNTNLNIDNTNMNIDNTNMNIDNTNLNIDNTNINIDNTNINIDNTNMNIDNSNANAERVEEEKLCAKESDAKNFMKDKISDNNRIFSENINIYDTNFSLKDSSSGGGIDESNMNAANEATINVLDRSDDTQNISGAKSHMETNREENVDEQIEFKKEEDFKGGISEPISLSQATTVEEENKRTDTQSDTQKKEEGVEEGGMLVRRRRRGREKPHFFDPLEYCVSFRKKRKVAKKVAMSHASTSTAMTATKSIEMPSDLPLTPLLSNSTPLLSNNTTLLSNSTPLLSNNTTLLSNSTPLLSNNTPLLSNNTPLLSNSTTLFSNNTTLLSNSFNNHEKASRTVCTRRNNINNNINNQHKTNVKSMLPKPHLHLLNNKNNDNDPRRYTGMLFSQNDKRGKQNTPTKNNKEDENKQQHNTNILFELNRKLLSVSAQPTF